MCPLIALVFISCFGLARPAKDIPSTCKAAFSRANIEKASDCEIKCAMVETDFSNFDCNRFCDDYCAQSKMRNSDPQFRLSDLYPGLTEAEKKIVDENPLKTAEAYRLSWKAESVCREDYLVSDTNDESDACRHFIWAGFLYSNLGDSFAEKVLNAQEANVDQPDNERKMDVANNKRGILAAKQLSNVASLMQN